MGEKKKSKKKVIITVIVIVLIVAVVVGVVYSSSKSKKNTGSDIVTEELTKHSIVASVSGTGTVAASTTEEVYTDLAGYKVKEVCVKVGDLVNAGDVICVLDVSDVEEQRSDAISSRDEAVADKATQDADYDQQVADAQSNRSERLESATTTRDEKKTAYENAKKDYKDYEKQYNKQKKDLIKAGKTESEAEAELSSMASTLQQKKTTMDSAKTEYDNAQTQVDNINDENDDSITDAKESYDETQQDTIDTYNDNIADLDETINQAVIRTNTTGAITELNVETGRTFNGSTVALVEGLSEFYVEANVDEYDIADVKEGMSVVMKTDATRDEELTGKVTYVALKASESSSTGGFSDYSSLLGGDLSSISGSSNSGDATFGVKISLDDQNERLRLGMNVQVSIITEEADDVLAVPYEYIQEREDGTCYIEVVDEENSGTDEEGNVITKTKEVDVTTGLEGSYYTEISSPDIKEG
ncbi:MAG: HlyD family secretion protein, partial [Lachnospiraceae bacterium]|nr:HlyD family secretion protein [Lachnospiraceae bacterium]